MLGFHLSALPVFTYSKIGETLADFIAEEKPKLRQTVLSASALIVRSGELIVGTNLSIKRVRWRRQVSRTPSLVSTFHFRWPLLFSLLIDFRTYKLPPAVKPQLIRDAALLVIQQLRSNRDETLRFGAFIYSDQ
jgi:hypothetical protein